MQDFHYSDGTFHAEGVSLTDIHQQFGSPCYVYSRSAIERQWKLYDDAFNDRNHCICYSVKANGNLAVLNILARLGSGFDIVSIGELHRVIKAGGAPEKTVFSGVGKRADEIRAAIEMGVKCLNVESYSELRAIDTIAGGLNRKAPVSIRVNPDVDPGTHPYISTGLKENKFGIAHDDAEAIYSEAARLPNLQVVGIASHIGSQITDLGPYRDVIDKLLVLREKLKAKGINIQHVDFGGGLGISYKDEAPPSPAELVSVIRDGVTDNDLEIIIEPGRSIVGNAGVLLCEVLYIKQNGDKYFAVIDAAMNDLIRPVLYEAWQEILPVEESSSKGRLDCDIVGPVCESGDFLGLDRNLPLSEGDLLSVLDVGAYGFVMSSNYNARPRAAEIMVDGSAVYEIRRREGLEDLYEGETILP